VVFDTTKCIQRFDTRGICHVSRSETHGMLYNYSYYEGWKLSSLVTKNELALTSLAGAVTMAGSTVGKRLSRLLNDLSSSYWNLYYVLSTAP